MGVATADHVIAFCSGPVVRGEEQSLVLDSVVYGDEGRYECTAYNHIGDRKHSARSRSVQVISQTGFLKQN